MTPTWRLAGVLTLVATALSVSIPSKADCAAPVIEISPDRGPAGAEVTVTGFGWILGCDDTGGGGCSADEHAEENDPEINIPLSFLGPLTGEFEREWRERGTSDTAAERFSVGEVDADEEGSFRERITVPHLPPGRYVVTSEIGGWQIFTIED